MAPDRAAVRQAVLADEDERDTCRRQDPRELEANQEGFNLIELLVVIAIAATMMALAVSFVGGSFRVQVKKEASHLIGTIRYLYNQAAVKNMSYRIVFDLENQAYWIESSENPFYLTTGAEDEAAAKKIKKEEKETETGGEEEPIPAFSTAVEEEEGFKKVVFDKEVRIRDVYVAHQEGLVTEGQASLYFFPNGMTELAVIHLSDEEQESNMSIIVNPLTGRCKVKTGYIDYETMEAEE
ncbi:MAG: prepilin-type N-terminal cleavage/methylation domain-containing protein [Deltaproteobacteria bacterium]|nr:prepilin-type N-terminal cleavage/methylation domain-containing protein [Deltaproteobacteria bacterium]